MHQVSTLVGHRIGARVHVHHDDVVKLEALYLLGIGDINAGLKAKVVALHAP